VTPAAAEQRLPLADTPSPVTEGLEVAPGCAILAAQDPPLPDGKPGGIVFGPGLSFARQREVVESFAWFDRMDKRKQGNARRVYTKEEK
jgi:hypothetical protein